jgi:hypothetical protein
MQALIIISQLYISGRVSKRNNHNDINQHDDWDTIHKPS